MLSIPTVRLEHSFAANAGAPFLSKRHEASNLRCQHCLTASVVAL